MDSRIIPQDFYVYLHRKATTGEVFYAGKGLVDRAWASKDRSAPWRNTVAKHGYTVEVVQDGLQEWAAFELEVALIALYGRRDLGRGPLVNLTDGGDGPAGQKFSATSRAQMARSAKARCATSEARARMAQRSREARVRDRGAIAAATKSAMARPEVRAKAAAGMASQQYKARQKAARDKARAEGRIGKAVVCNGVIRFDTQRQAAEWVLKKGRATGKTVSVQTNINRALRQEANSTAYGYTWTRVLPKRDGAVNSGLS